MCRSACLGLMVFLIAAAAAAQEATPEGNPSSYSLGPYEVMWDKSLPAPSQEMLTKEVLALAAKAQFDAQQKLGPEWEKEVDERMKVQVKDKPLEVTLVTNLQGAADPERLRGATNWAAQMLPSMLGSLARAASAQKLDRLEKEVHEQRNKVRELDTIIAQLRDELRQRSGFADVTPEGIQRALSEMDQQLRKLQLDMVGQSARQKALEAATAKAAKLAEERMNQDAVAAELEKIVAARLREVELLRKLAQNGRETPAAVNAAEAAVAEARARLLERREHSARGGGADLLMELNRELLMLTINAAETSARLDFAKDAVEKSRPMLSLLGELERRRIETGRAEAALADAEKSVAEFRRQAAAQEPNVSIRQKQGMFGR